MPTYKITPIFAATSAQKGVALAYILKIVERAAATFQYFFKLEIHVYLKNFNVDMYSNLEKKSCSTEECQKSSLV